MRKTLFILIIFLLFNGVIQVGFWIKDAFIDHNQVYRKYGKQTVLQAYPNLNESTVTELLEHTWNRPVVYDSSCYFTEATYTSRFVNVSEDHLRFGRRKPVLPLSDKSLNVFVFGGSTTFGYGQPDSLTLPSLLEESWRKNTIYNSGAGFYYSTQEYLRLRSLIEKGIKPDYVIFVDGLNEFDYPDDTLPVIAAGLKPSFSKYMRNAIAKIPVVRLVMGLKSRFTNFEKADPQITASESVQRYLANKNKIEQLCENHFIGVLFVIQPTPFYQYDRQYHLFKGEPPFAKTLAAGYSMLADSLSGDPNVLWLADMQEADTANNYVDLVHYTAEMHQRIAERIAQRVQLTR